MQKAFGLCFALIVLAFAGCGGHSNNIVPVVALQGPSSAVAGQPITLSWQTTNVAHCKATSSPIEADWVGSIPTAGSKQVVPTQNTTYTLVCFSYPSGNESSSVSVSVTGTSGGGGDGGGNNTGKVTSIAFAQGGCSPSTVLNGGSVNCNATVNGTGDFDSGIVYSASPDGSGTFDASGSFTPQLVSDPTTVTITAAAHGDPSINQSTTITVKPLINGFQQGSGCAPNTVNAGGASTCTAIPVGMPPFDAGITCKVSPANAGAITPGPGSTCNFVASTGFTGVANITASANADPSKTTAMTVNVAAATNSLTHLDITSPTGPVFCQFKCIVPLTFTVTNGQSGDQLAVGPFGGVQVLIPISDISSSPISKNVTVGGNELGMGLIEMQVVGADGAVSNTVTFIAVSNQRLVAQNRTTGEVYELAPDKSKVLTFKPDGTTLGTGFTINVVNPYAIAVDSKTGDVIVSHQGNPSATIYSATGTLLGAFGTGADMSSIAADNGNACGTVDGSAVIDCSLGIDSLSPPWGLYGGIRPWDVAVADNTAFVLDAGTPALRAIDLQTKNTVGILPLPFLAVNTAGSSLNEGTYTLTTMSAGNQRIIAVIGQMDSGATLEFVNATDPGAMTVQGPLVNLPANTFAIAADPKHNGVVVESWNVIGQNADFQRVLLDGTIQQSFAGAAVPASFIITADGSKMFVGIEGTQYPTLPLQ